MSMKCMIFVKASTDSEKGTMPGPELLAAMGKYNEELFKAGIMKGGGGAFDRLVGRQLRQQLDQQVDVYALRQALAGASVVSGMSVFSIAGVYQDQAAAREFLTDTAGTR